MGNIRNTKGRTWDVTRAVQEMTRFEFIGYFLARVTRTVAGREPCSEYKVEKSRSGWRVLMGDMVVHEPKDHGALFEVARRSPLAIYVHQAEDFRIDVLSAA